MHSPEKVEEKKTERGTEASLPVYEAEVIDDELVKQDGSVPAERSENSLAQKIGKVAGTVFSLFGLIAEIRSFFPGKPAAGNRAKPGARRRKRMRKGK